ncbi:S24 family peptidase [Shinella sp. G-2]|uniref:S24 family peptidase n=1 Tax=Shinella sp. G-2 TaxID=3133141 RepID=UPI003D036906
MPNTTFAQRLEIALSGTTIHAFAKKSGVGDSTLRRYLEGSMPGLDKLQAIAEAANVTLDWLVSERGPMRLDVDFQGGPVSLTLEEQKRMAEAYEEWVWLPVLSDVRPSAGPGALALNEQPTDFVAFNERWLRQQGITPSGAHILPIKGDSMEPTLRDGDVVIVDTTIDQVRDNAIYVIVYAGNLLVKRVSLMRNGSVTLVSDNPRHPPETVPPDEVPDLQIAGRVMWFGRTI